MRESSSSYVWSSYNGLPYTKFVIKNEEGATYTINGGTIEATNTCTAVLNNGEVIVNDGTIKTYYLCYGIVNYSGDAQIIVNDGVFEDYNTKSMTYGDEAYLISSFEEGNVKINGGKFYGSIDNRSSKVYEEGVSEPALNVTGGEFYKSKGISSKGSIASRNGEVWVIPGTDSTIISNNNITQEGILKVQNVNINANISNNGAKTLIENSSMNNVDISYSTSGSTYEAQIIGSTANGTIIARNSGNVLIKDSTTKQIENAGTGTIEIENCTVNEKLYNSSTGTIKISEVGTTTITGQYYGIDNYGAGTILIPGGNVTITAKEPGTSSYASYGISNSNAGTIVIGTKGGIPSTTAPRIKGGKYGIYNKNSNSQINFYDGIIIGKTDQAIYGKINEIEEGYSIVLNNVDSTQEATLQRLSILKTLKTNINSANLSGIEYTTSEDGNYYEFYSIQDAANASTNNTNTEFIAIRDISIAANFATQTIPANKNITIDLAGNKLDSSKEQAIVNKGKLTFVDSSAENTEDKTVGILVNQKDFIINEEGSTLNLNAIKLKLNTRGNSSEYNYMIKNDGTANLTDVIGDMEDTSYFVLCQNTGTFNANGGEYTQSDSNDESRFIENNDEAVATISNSKLVKVDLYNYDEATMKLIDTELESRITNESPKVFEEGVSEPAVRITGCTFDLVGYSGREYARLTLQTSNGEMLFENNEETGKILTVIQATTSNYKYGGTLKTTTNGIISINSGEILRYNNIDNSEDGIVNIRSGYLEGVNINNKGELNIGTNDSTIISYTDLQYDEENNIIKDIGAPIINREQTASISNTGIINFYDGVIASDVYHGEVVNGRIGNIATDAEVLFTKFENYNTYSLSKTTPVAKIGTKEYTTLQAAINACNSTSTSQIDMQKSIVIANGHSYDLGDKKIKLNMNGNTIISHDISHDESQRTNILFTTSGEFEITDTSTEQTGKIYAYYGGIVKNSGKLKISGCDFTINNGGDNKAQKSATIIENIDSGTVEMTGGQLNTTYNYVSSGSTNYDGYGIYSTSTGNVTVTGGTINLSGMYQGPNSYGIFVDGSGNETKSNLTIEGDVILHKLNDYGSYGFEVKNCNVKITGGNNDANNRMTNSDAIVSGGITSGTTTLTDKISTLLMNNSNATMGSVTNSGKVTVTAGNITGTFDNNATWKETDDVGMYISGANVTGCLDNGGTATIDNIELTEGGYIYNTSGTMEVNNITADVNASYALYVRAGNVNLYNSTLTNTKEGTSANGIYVYGGTLNIPYYTEDDQVNQVEVNCTNGNGLYQTGGTVTLGDLNYPVYKTYPKISGGTYGIKKTGGTLNFYDGILYGTTKAFDGAITKMPDVYSLVLQDEDTVGFLDIIPTSQGAAKIGENSNYNTIQGAINAVNTYSGEKKATIVLLKDSSITDTINVPETADVTIDLQGHSIRGANADNPIIENNGKLTIIDTATTASSTTYGYVQNVTGVAIENKGTLVIGTNDDTMLAKAPKIFGGTYGIDTTKGTLTIYDGTVEGVTDAINGTITGPNGYVITDGTETLNANSENEVTYKTKYLVAE